MKSFLRKSARAELNEAAAYYESLREDLGDEFIEDFLLALTEIEESPYRWPQIATGLRRFRLSRFPYAIIYRIAGQMIDIIVVTHLSRRDDYWHDRLP